MLSLKNQNKTNGTGGYLDHLFDDNSKDTETTPEPLIDSTRLRKDLKPAVYTKAKQNRQKKFPYVYGPKLPQLDPKHLYNANGDVEDDLTLVAHPNQPSVPKSIPKRDKRQTKDAETIKGKLTALNQKQDTLINRTATYNDVYPEESENKVTKDINPITKPVYKLWGRFKNDKDLKSGKKVKYEASAPKNPIWQRFSSKTGEAEATEGAEATEDVEATEATETTEVTESTEAEVKENIEGLGDVDRDTHDVAMNKTRTTEQVDADIKENLKGVDGEKKAAVDTEAIKAADGAVEVDAPVAKDAPAADVSKDIDPEAIEAADGAVEHDDVESKISYNPVFFINKKTNKNIQKSYESPLQAVSTKFKNLVNYQDKKATTNADNIKDVDELKQQQDANIEKITVLTDEVVKLQEKCQPLHFKKLDELERQNDLKKFHHKVDLYKHEQEKLTIEKKKIEKERRHRGRDYNREMRSGIRKQRQLQKEKRDLKKEQLRSYRRHQRKVTHFNEMKKKFVTDVESETFEAPVFADDESEHFIQPVESVKEVKEEEVAKDVEGEEEEPKFTKEFIEPDTPEEYEAKIKEIGKEYDFISNEPLISHEEEKELTKLKEEIDAKKDEINKLSGEVNTTSEAINAKLAKVSEFKPPGQTKAVALDDIKAPLLSTNFKTINTDFTVATDDEFVLSDPSDVSEIPEYVPVESSDESALSSEKMSSSDIGEETDSDEEGHGLKHVPVGYMGVLPQRGFLRSVEHDGGVAKAMAAASVPAVYDSWVIHEGTGADNVAPGFKGILPQNKFLDSVTHNKSAGAHLKNAKVPDVYGKWVIQEGTGADEVTKGFKGVLPQNKYLDSVTFDKSTGAALKNAKVPSVYGKWVVPEGTGADEITKGFKGVLPQNKFLDSVTYDKSTGAALKDAAVPDVYGKWANKSHSLVSVPSNAYTTYTEVDIVTVPSGYKLNEKVL